MGNRAIIQTRESYENEGIGVYLHWNGGYDSVSAFLKYCELKGYRAPDTDSYGWARLCQVIGNFFGGSTSLGIDNFSKDAGEWQDNGTYIIKGWEIVGRECWGDNYSEQNNYDMETMLLSIDEAQPVKEQLGKEFILAEEIPVSELIIGDEVYMQDFDGSYRMFTVQGFGENIVNGSDMTGIPYVNRYGYNDYASNCNNYIRTETIRRSKHSNVVPLF